MSFMFEVYYRSPEDLAREERLWVAVLISASLRPKRAVPYASRSHSIVATRLSLRQRPCGSQESTSRESRIMGESWPNKPAAGNAGIAAWLTIGRHWPGVPEPER